MSLFRGANYEHENEFFGSGGKCLNIELIDSEGFSDRNELKLPADRVPRLGSLSFFDLLYSLESGIQDDLLDILCYESLVLHFELLPVRGKLDWIRKIKERIYDDPLTPISLNRFSTQFDLHPNYIVRKFKEVTGYRLSEYLNRIRIEYSISRMIGTGDSLTKIAHDAGFCDQSHFNRNFRKFFSTSPKIYRKSVRKKIEDMG